LASKLVGWDIEIMTIEELTEGVEKAERWFGGIPNVPENFAESMITEGFLSYEDITFLEPEQLAEMVGVTPEAADEFILYCEEQAERIEREGESEQDRAPVVAVTEDTEPTPEEIAAAEAALAEQQGEEVVVEAEAEPAPVEAEVPSGKGLDALFSDDPK
jgi:N utilization substance protein A